MSESKQRKSETREYLLTEGKDLLKSLISPKHHFKKIMELGLRNTEGQGDIIRDGLSIITGPIRSNFYDGKLHDNTNPVIQRKWGGYSKFTNEHYDPNNNMVRQFVFKDNKNFKKSKYNPGIYIGTKYENYPGYEGNYYNIDKLEIPIYMKPYINKLGGKHVNVNKDFLINDYYIDLNNTYDARNHYITVYGDMSKPTFRFDDVFDISLDFVNKLNNPFRLTQVLDSEYVPNDYESNIRNASESILIETLSNNVPNFLSNVDVFPDKVVVNKHGITKYITPKK